MLVRKLKKPKNNQVAPDTSQIVIVESNSSIVEQEKSLDSQAIVSKMRNEDRVKHDELSQIVKQLSQDEGNF